MKKGEKMTDELKKKISLSQIGYKYPNRKLSDSHKRNISLARKKEWENGRRKMFKMTPEIIDKIRVKHIGKKASIETRKKQSDVRKNSINTPRGHKHHNWKGGISPSIHKIRSSLEYRLWREAIFKRDNYTCVWCRARSSSGNSVIIHADHIKRFSEYPELRFSIDNGRTLCISCHKKTETYGGKKI